MTTRALLLGGSGAALVVLVLLDAGRTALAPTSGGGPLTRGCTRLVAAVASRRRGSALVRTLAGPATLVATVSAWLGLLWAGWVLVFSATPGAVRDGQTGLPVGVDGRIYFAGYAVSTLGVGDVVPGDGLWRVLTAVAAFLGLALVTLAITYLLGVVGAVASRRRLAQQLNGYGASGAGLLLAHLDGGRLDPHLGLRLDALATEVLAITEQHLAYPVLHAFLPAERAASLPRAVALLDDALVLLQRLGPEQGVPVPAVLGGLGSALEGYARTVHHLGRGQQDPAPDPDPAPLRRAGLQVDDPVLGPRERERRDRIARLVSSASQTWPRPVAAGPP